MNKIMLKFYALSCSIFTHIHVSPSLIFVAKSLNLLPLDLSTKKFVRAFFVWLYSAALFALSIVLCYSYIMLPTVWFSKINIKNKIK
jgi:hypothetical protein